MLRVAQQWNASIQTSSQSSPGGTDAGRRLNPRRAPGFVVQGAEDAAGMAAAVKHLSDRNPPELGTDDYCDREYVHS